jgi:ABC-type nitrate/sulfonate/bicarbonate transport system ATPase subunit
MKEGEVGFVFQNYIVFEHLTVEENLLLSAYQGMFREHAGEGHFKNMWDRLKTWLLNKKVLREKVDQYLDHFQLREHLGKNPCQLSGGQRQRLAILSQVLCSSRVFILDEPFSGQDPIMKQECCETLIKVGQLDEFETLLIITHDIECAIWVSDTLLPLGREKDTASKKFTPGSTVFKPFNLADRGLAWQDASICRTSEFADLVSEIKYEWFPNM